MKLQAIENWLKNSSLKIPALYLVGGGVRDLALREEPKDIDIVCRGAREFAYNLAGEKNASIVSMEKKPRESCYRVVGRDNCNNFIDIAEMRGETIQDDLQARDFTINAIAVEIKNGGTLGATIDPLKGMEDINRKIIRLTNNKAIISDPLRILRALRFAAALNFSVEQATLDELKANAGLLTKVSVERIMSELLLILKTSGSSSFFRQMDQMGILEVILPEIKPMKGCAQNGFHHKDVWEHSLLTMENCEHIINKPADFFGAQEEEVISNLTDGNRLPLLKLAALLHDIGKPLTRTLNPDTERIIFYRHDEEGARLVTLLAERLKLSNTDKELLTLLVAEHLHVISLAKVTVRPSTIMKWFRKMKDDSISEIILSIADVKGSLGVDSSEEFRDYYINWAMSMVIRYYKGIKFRLERQGFITGRDLIALGIGPGPQLGRMLDNIRNAQDTGEINSTEDAIAMVKTLKEL